MKKPVLTMALALAVAFSIASFMGVAESPAPEGVQDTSEEADSYAQYLANAGVLIAHGETKVAFDPIFRSSFGSYLLLSEELEKSLFAGKPPFDGLDAIFISHYHGDHFSARDVLDLMVAHKQLRLFAPKQAVDGILRINRVQKPPAGAELLDRIHSIELDYEADPITLHEQDLLVEAVRIPHSGWPDRMQDVENIAFRVSLLGGSKDGTDDTDTAVTAAHLGDADVRDDHFDHDAGYWAKRPLDIAFPPYWYLQSEDGRAILTTRLNPALTVGVHVPEQFGPDDKAAVTSQDGSVSVFTDPLERRLLVD